MIVLESGLSRFHIVGLPAFRAFDHIELHLLPFLQAAKSAGLNRREVHKHVLAVLAADKTITFGIVKPLDCSGFDKCSLFLLVECSAETQPDFSRQVML